MNQFPISQPHLGKEELAYVTKCFQTAWISSQGKFVDEFEKDFSKKCNMPYGIAVSNGTAALHLALTALGITKEDEVIVPDFTFVATANAVIYCGATPILVDVTSDTWNIDPQKIRETITEKTKAIIPVHLFGQPCDMDAIMQIAREHDLFVVEDCAQAHGAMYKGKIVGTFGDISTFSFFGNKIITTGEGGMCLTRDEKLDALMRVLRDHGMSKEKRYWHDRVGFNYRITNMQAAIGVAQTARLEIYVEKRIHIASEYMRHLENTPNLTFPTVQSDTKNVYWLFSCIVKDNASRERLVEELKKRGIDARRFFYALTSMPPYSSEKSNPISLDLSSRGISFPTYFDLSDENIAHICKEIDSIMRS